MSDLTAIATAVGVLQHNLDCRRRPPLDHISPAAAALRHAQPEEDLYIPTWRDFGAAVLAVVVFWFFYVATWAIWGA